MPLARHVSEYIKRLSLILKFQPRFCTFCTLNIFFCFERNKNGQFVIFRTCNRKLLTAEAFASCIENCFVFTQSHKSIDNNNNK